MRAVDTNVVVRYLAADHPSQTARAKTLIDGSEVWISLTVVLETEWVLRRSYGFRPAAITASLRTLVGQPTVQAENPQALAWALDLCDTGMDFADALHVAVAGHCNGFDTFDAALAKAAVHACIGNVSLLQ
jgi:predicted nucleic-acid-binding protein